MTACFLVRLVVLRSVFPLCFFLDVCSVTYVAVIAPAVPSRGGEEYVSSLSSLQCGSSSSVGVVLPALVVLLLLVAVVVLVLVLVSPTVYEGILSSNLFHLGFVVCLL